MRAKPVGKYELKDLYQEIDLFDRKISYCQTLETFASEEGRAAALQKLVTRRKSLVKVAVAAVSDGVECDPKYLPRSLKTVAPSEEPAS
jgi:hypothetical protein